MYDGHDPTWLLSLRSARPGGYTPGPALLPRSFPHSAVCCRVSSRVLLLSGPSCATSRVPQTCNAVPWCSAAPGPHDGSRAVASRGRAVVCSPVIPPWYISPFAAPCSNKPNKSYVQKGVSPPLPRVMPHAAAPAPRSTGRPGAAPAEAPSREPPAYPAVACAAWCAGALAVPRGAAVLRWLAARGPLAAAPCGHAGTRHAAPHTRNAGCCGWAGLGMSRWP